MVSLMSTDTDPSSFHNPIVHEIRYLGCGCCEVPLARVLYVGRTTSPLSGHHPDGGLHSGFGYSGQSSTPQRSSHRRSSRPALSWANLNADAVDGARAIIVDLTVRLFVERATGLLHSAHGTR